MPREGLQKFLCLLNERDEFRAVIHGYFGRLVPPSDDAFQNPFDPRCRKVQINLVSQYLPFKVVRHVKRPEPATTEPTVVHEIHRPALINGGCNAQWLRVSCRESFLAPSALIQVECTMQLAYPLTNPLVTPA